MIRRLVFTVLFPYNGSGPDVAKQTFAKQDLPKEHRVLGPDSMGTMDHKPERLNIHVDEEGTVKDVKFG